MRTFGDATYRRDVACQTAVDPVWPRPSGSFCQSCPSSPVPKFRQCTVNLENLSGENTNKSFAHTSPIRIQLGPHTTSADQTRDVKTRPWHDTLVPALEHPRAETDAVRVRSSPQVCIA